MEDAEARLRALQEEQSDQSELLQNRGWKTLMVTAQEQLQLRLPEALSKTTNLQDILGKEFEKGVIAGVELFVSLPGIRKEALRLDILNVEEELGYAEGDRGEDGSRGDGDSGDGEFESPVA